MTLFKGEQVDEDWLAAPEQHVVGGCVLKPKTLFENVLSKLDGQGASRK